MIRELQLRLLPEQAANEQALKRMVCREIGDSPDSVKAVRILKRSIDARQRTVYVNVSLRAFINEIPAESDLYSMAGCPAIEYKDVSRSRQVIIVGAGPAGLFAALRLIESGLKPVVVERGKNVHDRKKDIALINRGHVVNPESNYCFGEGGAGAFSDGKLYTRSKKRGSVDRILNILHRFGAAPAILQDARPHIGTDKLPRIIENIRNKIIECGGEVHFETRMMSLIIKNREVRGIITANFAEMSGPVILATGHSARDVYKYLSDNKIQIREKGIAAGIRLEHPQMLIDRIRYHRKEGRGDFLPAAEYGFTAQSGGRGVYSFCMCPGGFIVPATCTPQQVAVNGMSPSHRNSCWANAGIVVEIRPEDLSNGKRETGSGLFSSVLLSHGALGMMYVQEHLERLAWIHAGMKQAAPAQRMLDFVQKRNSSDLPESSYMPGLVTSPLHLWLPEFITARLRDGFRRYDRISHGFLTNEAVLAGVETRTSSPVSILRDHETFQHVDLKGLYPCGEGAGYAGGIVSAAIDGENCAKKIANFLCNTV
jgi:uncharacterized FAD-dependent dehydrogenase